MVMSRQGKSRSPANQKSILFALLCLTIVLTFVGCARVQEMSGRDVYAQAPSSPAIPWRSPTKQEQITSLSTTDTLGAEASQTGKGARPYYPGLAAVPDLEKTYDLVDLIDLAQRTNPETRRAWEQARAAAARLGLADSAYYPTLALLNAAGYSRVEDRGGSGPVYTVGPSTTPQLALQWVLLDFGRRDAAFASSAQQLLEANFHFNRKHQEITYAVQRSFYAFDAGRARVTAALATLKTATSVQTEAEARMNVGLATQPEVLLTRQERARAAYEVEAARRGVEDARAALAESLGIAPTVPLRVAELSTLPLPTNLTESVEQTIDRALAQRPDLAARLAALRAREAEIRKARADFLPTLSVVGRVGGTAGSFTAQTSNQTFDYAEPTYGTFLSFSWELFDGFARHYAVREAEARRGEAAADLSVLQLKMLREVWKAYADVKTALLQHEYAEALLKASQDAYDATSKGYRSGLNSIIELLTAERDLARARVTEIESRADLLNAAAALAFAAGDS